MLALAVSAGAALALPALRSEPLHLDEAITIEYAERFALAHLELDDEFFARLREHFSDADILDLTICIADFLAFGRLTEVLRLDQECSLEFP